MRFLDQAIVPQGPFSLKAAAEFGFGPNEGRPPPFAGPRRLALPDHTPGLHAEKLARLRGVARAALAGELDVERLRELGPERAYQDVQRLKGLGPFYAGLVVLRASGFADAMLASTEPKVL